jgi:N-acetylneuraminic acid mutarotase
MFILDTNKDTNNNFEWKKVKQDGKVPIARTGMQACTIKQKVYTFGGLTHSEGVYFEDLNEFDISTSQWRACEGPNPSGRVDHSFVSL